MLQFTHAIATQLSECPGQSEAALQLFLTGALAASEEARLEFIAYEFVEQVIALTLRLVYISVLDLYKFCEGILH